MAFLSWLLRAIVLTIIVNVIYRLIVGSGRRSTRGPSAGPGPQPRSGGPIERAGGALVRDPHCGTYVPQSSAIRAGTGASALYFCSEACRSAYTTAHKAS